MVDVLCSEAAAVRIPVVVVREVDGEAIPRRGTVSVLHSARFRRRGAPPPHQQPAEPEPKPHANGGAKPMAGEETPAREGGESMAIVDPWQTGTSSAAGGDGPRAPPPSQPLPSAAAFDAPPARVAAAAGPMPSGSRLDGPGVRAMAAKLGREMDDIDLEKAMAEMGGGYGMDVRPLSPPLCLPSRPIS